MIKETEAEIERLTNLMNKNLSTLEKPGHSVEFPLEESPYLISKEIFRMERVVKDLKEELGPVSSRKKKPKEKDLPKLVLISPYGLESSFIPKNKETFVLEELQVFVGGNIERLTLSDEKHMYCNEEGKLLGLLINEKATGIAKESFGPSFTDFICGNVVIGHPSVFGD